MPELKQLQLHNRTRPEQPPLTARHCASFFCRLRGLTFRTSLPPNWGLLLVQKKENRVDAAIHMLFMRIDLAIVWINAAGTVVDVQPAYRWRSFLTPKAPARYVLETSLDQLERYSIGDEVHFEEIPAH